MICRRAVIFAFIMISLAAWGAQEPAFTMKGFHRDASGVTFRTASGTIRIELCGDRVIHVVASQGSEIPAAKVPIAIQPCLRCTDTAATQSRPRKMLALSPPYQPTKSRCFRDAAPVFFAITGKLTASCLLFRPKSPIYAQILQFCC
jgi:hypothetical protein